ncbi:MAG: PEP-CTERM sorting domain-containing protein [Opitutaceae bacterium]
MPEPSKYALMLGLCVLCSVFYLRKRT